MAAGFAGYYFLQLGKMHSINNELEVAQAEFNAVQSQAKVEKERDDELSSKVRSSELLVKRIENRFYWAPLLEQLMQSVPKDVQLTKLSADLSGEDLIRRLDATPATEYLVLEGDGAIVGILATADVNRAVQA
jgi:hypothetical protein